MPIYSKSQKLSKIETLRIAKNYIAALTDILKSDSVFDPLTFARTLSKGLSQTTVSLIANLLNLNPQAITESVSNGCIPNIMCDQRPSSGCPWPFQTESSISSTDFNNIFNRSIQSSTTVVMSTDLDQSTSLPENNSMNSRRSNLSFYDSNLTSMETLSVSQHFYPSDQFGSAQFSNLINNSSENIKTAMLGEVQVQQIGSTINGSEYVVDESSLIWNYSNYDRKKVIYKNRL